VGTKTAPGIVAGTDAFVLMEIPGSLRGEAFGTSMKELPLLVGIFPRQAQVGQHGAIVVGCSKRQGKRERQSR